MLYGSIYVIMFFMSNSSFYMLLLTYMHQNKNKNIKYIYYKKKAPRNAPELGAFENVVPAHVPAPK